MHYAKELGSCTKMNALMLRMIKYLQLIFNSTGKCLWEIFKL